MAWWGHIFVCPRVSNWKVEHETKSSSLNNCFGTSWGNVKPIVINHWLAIFFKCSNFLTPRSQIQPLHLVVILMNEQTEPRRGSAQKYEQTPLPRLIGRGNLEIVRSDYECVGGPIDKLNESGSARLVRKSNSLENMHLFEELQLTLMRGFWICLYLIKPWLHLVSTAFRKKGSKQRNDKFFASLKNHHHILELLLSLLPVGNRQRPGRKNEWPVEFSDLFHQRSPTGHLVRLFILPCKTNCTV